MHDEELDRLFKSKLKNMEATPADKVWEGIVLELDGVKRKNSLWLVVMLAALVIATLFACGMFIAKNIHANPAPVQTNSGLVGHQDN